VKQIVSPVKQYKAKPAAESRAEARAGGAMSLAIHDLGRLLVAKRARRGIRDAALEAGVSPATFSRVENGHIPDLKTFTSLCKWLGRDPREFLGMAIAETPPTPQPSTVVHFRKKKTVKMETAKALGELILAAQRAVLAAESLVGR
jgi:transcriptional regulator with XRE-family HTH domain